MADETLDPLGPVWKRLDRHSEMLARHDEAIDGLKASTSRLEARLAEVRDEMGRGFDRMTDAIGKVSEQALRAYPPEAADEIGATRAAEARARAYALSLLAGLLVCGGIIAALIVR